MANTNKYGSTERLSILTILPDSKALTKDDWRNFWLLMHKGFFDTLRDIRINLYIMIFVNVLIAAMGVVFFIISMNLLLYGQGDMTKSTVGLISGSISIATFISLFFIKPQQYITKALGNIAQIQFVYRSNLLIFSVMVDAYNSKIENNPRMQLDELVALNKELERTTRIYVQIIEKFVEFEVKNEDDAKS